MKVLPPDEVKKATIDLESLYKQAMDNLEKNIFDQEKKAQLKLELDNYHTYAQREMKTPYISFPKKEQLLRKFKNIMTESGIPINSAVKKLKELIAKEHPSDAKTLLKVGASLILDIVK